MSTRTDQPIEPRTINTNRNPSEGKSLDRKLRLSELGNIVNPALLNPDIVWNVACHSAVGAGKYAIKRQYRKIMPMMYIPCEFDQTTESIHAHSVTHDHSLW